MGPQLYRCGNIRCGCGRRRAGIRFNGAATLSLRKLSLDPANIIDQPAASMGPQLYRCGNLPAAFAWRPLWAGFNGAATLSLRKPPKVDQLVRAYDGLQWGRNFIVAETGACVYGGAQHGQASMGPQLYRCGNLMPLCSLSSCFSLQWGRNFIVAETHANLCR